jgi:hypothetical protein
MPPAHVPLADHPLLEVVLPVAVLTALDGISHLADTERQHLAVEAANTEPN